RRVRDAIAVGVDEGAGDRAAGHDGARSDDVPRDETAADRPDALAAGGQQRVQPALRAVLVANVEPGQRVTQPIDIETVGDRGAELDRVLVTQLEERAKTRRHHRL